jgi:hypothetical protein
MTGIYNLGMSAARRLRGSGGFCAMNRNEARSRKASQIPTVLSLTRYMNLSLMADSMFDTSGWISIGRFLQLQKWSFERDCDNAIGCLINDLSRWRCFSIAHSQMAFPTRLIWKYLSVDVCTLREVQDHATRFLNRDSRFRGSRLSGGIY